MLTPDVINAVFEALGAYFTAKNVLQVRRDKGYAGIYLPAIAFFFAWGFWNLFFYPHLGQWWSFGAGLLLVCANLAWVVSMLYYGRIKPKPEPDFDVLSRRLMEL